MSYYNSRYKGELIDGSAELEGRLSKVLFDPYFSPIVAKDLSGLPDAYVMTCEFDTLRDDGLIYAKRLEKAGVKVTNVYYEGGYHGIFNYVTPPLTTEIGLRSVQDIVNYLQKQL